VTQQWPWASGEQKKAAPAAPKRRRRRRKMSPAGRALLAFWEGGGLILLGCAQLFEMSALVFAGVTSMALGAVGAWVDTHRDGAVPAPTAARPKSAKPPKTKGSGGGGSRPGTATVICTQTGVPVDKCTAGHKHAMTAEGVRRFKQCKRVGDPYGKATTKPVSTPKQPKQPRVPTTNTAKPIPVGEPMRRVL
jgi:hypothetical protein